MSIPLLETEARGSGSLAIAQALRRTLASGEVAEGDRLPHIGALARYYGSTPITVRKALSALEGEGLVRVEHGVGTFVCEDWSVGHDLLHLPSFAEQMAGQHLAVETVVRAFEGPIRHTEAARALHLPPESPLGTIARVRRVGGTPIAFQRSYVPEEWREALRVCAEGESLYRALRERTGRIPAAADERLDATELPPDPARELEAGAGAAGWHSTRTTYDADGRPLVFDEAWFPADRVSLRVRRRPRQALLELEVRGRT